LNVSEGTRAHIHQVGQLQTKNVLERERELAKYKKEEANLARLAMLPRFDAQTMTPRDPNAPKPQRPLCDLVENQLDPCDWKPDVDNPHCRYNRNPTLITRITLITFITLITLITLIISSAGFAPSGGA